MRSEDERLLFRRSIDCTRGISAAAHSFPCRVEPVGCSFIAIAFKAPLDGRESPGAFRARAGLSVEDTTFKQADVELWTMLDRPCSAYANITCMCTTALRVMLVGMP